MLSYVKLFLNPSVGKKYRILNGLYKYVFINYQLTPAAFFGFFWKKKFSLQSIDWSQIKPSEIAVKYCKW